MCNTNSRPPRQRRKSNDAFRSIDFDGLYRAQRKRSSFGSRTAADWDTRAAQRHRADRKNDYNDAFLAHVNLKGAQSILDIGCGVGNLAIPLAKRLRRVYALDFSPEMLRYLRLQARRECIRNIRFFLRSWTDSWTTVPTADVVICSRAMGVADLRAALVKMTRQARLRCYATLNVGGRYLSPDVERLLGRDIAPRPDYIYAVNILYQMGLHARVDFIRSIGGHRYASEDEFIASTAWRIGRLTARERNGLSRFYSTLPRDSDGCALHTHAFEWALLAWEKP